MPKVTLAYPTEHDGVTHQPDTTLDVDEVTARQWLAEGTARPADSPAEMAGAKPDPKSDSKSVKKES